MDDWNSLDRMITAVKPWLQLFLFAYIFFISFTMASLWTGVMADHMNDVRQKEEEEERQQEQEAVETAMDTFRQTFTMADTTADNSMDFKEFEQMLKSKEIMGLLKSVGIDITGLDARELFEFFDIDCSG